MVVMMSAYLTMRSFLPLALFLLLTACRAPAPAHIDDPVDDPGPADSTFAEPPPPGETNAPEPTDTPEPSFDPATEYVACGCGCCGGEPPVEYTCVTGQRLERIRRDDAQARKAPHCARAGCSLGTRYRVCEAGSGTQRRPGG